MIRALATGTLYGDPQARISKTGGQFATAKIKADGKDGKSTWISVVAFGDTADRLLTLHADSAVSVSGEMEVSAYTAKDGTPAAGLSIVADELAALKAKPKPVAHQRPVPVVAGFDDDLPDWS